MTLKSSVITGERYGRLTIIKELQPETKYKRRVFLCKCDCGNETKVKLDHIKRGTTTSCGCYKKEIKTTHGLSTHRLRNVWKCMMARCYNKSSIDYGNYGERGITVCKEWHNISEFIKDMNESFSEGLQLDRIDNDKGYSRYNCKWSTVAEQSRNRRTNKVVKYDGSDYTLGDFAKEIRTCRVKVSYWLAKGLTPKEIADKFKATE